MRMIRSSLYIALFAFMLCLGACAPAEGNRTGHEFMPDMVHSTAYEANIYNYYYYNTWGSEEEYHEMVQPRLPVEGTIPRGFTGVASSADLQSGFEALSQMQSAWPENNIVLPKNGAVPYYYGGTEEERIRAMEEIVNNPIPITADGIEEGKKLYTIYCAVCHGPKGDGLGYLVRESNPQTGDPGGKYPAQPANLVMDEFVQATNGRFYHSIMQGRNMMGAYADKLSYVERWQVIHYIRSLQANKVNLQYDENVNTLNNTAVPANTLNLTMDKEKDQNAEGGHGSDTEIHQGETPGEQGNPEEDGH